MDRKTFWVFSIVGLLVVSWFISLQFSNYVAKSSQEAQVSLQKDIEAQDKASQPRQSEKKEPSRSYPTTIHAFKKNETFYNVMLEYDVSPSLISLFADLALPHADLSRIEPRTTLEIYRESDTGALSSVRIYNEVTKYIVISRDKESDKWQAQVVNLPVVLKNITYSGTIEDSLWRSAKNAGVDDSVTFRLVEIFAWQIDFEREVRPGDSWSFMVEEKRIGDRVVDWGKIFVAEYHKGEETYEAVLYPQVGADGEYYNRKGESLKGLFLRSPIAFGRISSHFQKKRFHPILKTHRPHNGVDYAAPTGTSIFAVGDGEVTRKEYNKGAGNMLKIRHNSRYSTAYKHLSRFAKKIKKHGKVKQGQVIGYVGSTGLATGPHLHFEFYQDGKFIDPLGKKFPRKESLKQEDLSSFTKVTDAVYEEFRATLATADE